MKILILNWKDIKHPQVGGAEIIVYELAKRMVRDGHEVIWFTRNFKGAKKTEIIDGIKIVRQGNLITEYIYAPIYYWTMEVKPDLVIDMCNTIYWQTPIWAWKSKKIAYLNQLGMEVFDYEFSFPLSWFGKVIERIQYITYKKMLFLAYSKSTRGDLALMGIDRKNVKLFSLGLDHDRYTKGKKSKTPLFICVSRLVRMKRTDLAIEAMSILTKKYNNAKLVIIGFGYERERLQNLRDKLKLKDNVIFQDENILFFNKDEKDAKAKLMQKSWTLLFPSVKEGWGMTVTECAACGTTTIATDVTGLRDSVINNKTGLLISSNPTATELASVLTKLIENEKLRNILEKEAYKKAREMTWEKSYSEFSKHL